MSGRWKGIVVFGVLLAACGGGDPVMPDADPGPDAGEPDAEPDAGITACLEFGAPLQITEVPTEVDGDLTGAGADLVAPAQCATVDAPFGIETAGADRVYALHGLDAGTEYVVRLDSPEDLSFYVVTGCSGVGGPTSGQCALFVDALVDAPEVGRFTADGPDAYVVIDYYAAGDPPAGDFTLEVYAVSCQASVTCGGVTPVCQDFRCVGCASDFDCDDAAAPLCDEPSHVCEAGYNTCVGDDGGESGDDGPAGATTLVPGAPISHAICNAPAAERDFYTFHVSTPGEHWTIDLDWSAAVDLDLDVYDADGDLMGRSYYEHPEGVALTYLPAGDYYVEVDYYAASQTNVVVPYTIAATRVTGETCASPADCAGEWRNQIFRGACVAGACRAIEGDGALAPGQRCDSASDCSAAGTCASFFFVEDADTRMTCGTYCDVTADCAALGAEYICTDYLADNFCVQKCTDADHCPTLPLSAPATPPWLRFGCQISTGRCVPP